MGAKENNGKARLRYQLRKIIIVASTCILIVVVKYLSVGRNKVDDQNVGNVNLRKNKGHSNSSENAAKHVEHNIEKILKAKLHLVDVFDPTATIGVQVKDRVAADFCHLKWELHKSAPSQYAMFRELVAGSPCGGERIHIPDIGEVARLARERDEAEGSTTKSMPLKGVVFHESRVGSTLVANSLAASKPANHRVYSESSPPISLLGLCDKMGNDFCTSPKTVTLFQDIVYLMGRTSDLAETSMFFKIQSAGTKGMSLFRAAFPDVPWIFVYREPVQVMMSHLALPPGMKMTNSNCLRSYKRPSKNYKKMVAKLGGGRTMKELSHEDHCALHLASICQPSIDEQFKSQTGRMVNYAELPGALVDDIFPNHFGIPVTEVERQNIEEVCTHYSKGKRDKKWNEKGDSEKKEKMASEAVKEASRVFLAPSYEWLEKENRKFSSGS